MDHRQQELRRAAAQDFLDSLHQLEDTFKPGDDEINHPAPPVQPPPPMDERLKAIEAAAADIERFLQELGPGD